LREYAASYAYGRWVSDINHRVLDNDTGDEGTAPDGYYDVHSHAEDCDVEEDEVLPPIPPNAKESQVILQRDASGNLSWLLPARFDFYGDEERMDSLAGCDETMRSAADVIDAMLAALREAYLTLECRDGTARVTEIVRAAIAQAEQP
jgi:hypothetical protein